MCLNSPGDGHQVVCSSLFVVPLNYVRISCDRTWAQILWHHSISRMWHHEPVILLAVFIERTPLAREQTVKGIELRQYGGWWRADDGQMSPFHALLLALRSYRDKSAVKMAGPNSQITRSIYPLIIFLRSSHMQIKESHDHSFTRSNFNY